MEPHETIGNTPSGDPNAVWFDDWSTGGAFELTNERTTSVWRPMHLLGMTAAAKKSAKHSAFEQQMTWDDESTTRMWNAQLVAQSFFAATQRQPVLEVPPVHVSPEVMFQDIPAPRTQPPPPPPRSARQTGAHPPAAAAAVRQTGAHAPVRNTQPMPAYQTGGYAAPAHQTGGYAAPAYQTGGYAAPARQTGGYASARTTGARPSVRTTQQNRPIVTAAELGLATGVHDELFARVHTQQISWLWTLFFSGALFAAVLMGMVLLPIGTPNIRGISPQTPVLRHVDSFDMDGTAGKVEAPAPAQPSVAAEPSAEPAVAAEPTATPSTTAAAAPAEAEPQAHRAASAAKTSEPRAPKPRATDKLKAAAAAPAAKPAPVTPSPAPASDKTDKASSKADDKARANAAPVAPEPEAAAAREPARSAAAVKREEATASRTAVRNQEPGMLRINSRPWAQIFIDGQPRGATPQMGLPLKAGHHTVQLVNTPLRMSKTFPLDIQSGEIVTKVVNLIE